MIRKFRYWLILKLARKDSIALNLDISPEGITLKPLSLCYNNTVTNTKTGVSYKIDGTIILRAM